MVYHIDPHPRVQIRRTLSHRAARQQARFHTVGQSSSHIEPPPTWRGRNARVNTAHTNHVTTLIPETLLVPQVFVDHLVMTKRVEALEEAVAQAQTDGVGVKSPAYEQATGPCKMLGHDTL